MALEMGLSLPAERLCHAARVRETVDLTADRTPCKPSPAVHPPIKTEPVTIQPEKAQSGAQCTQHAVGPVEGIASPRRRIKQEEVPLRNQPLPRTSSPEVSLLNCEAGFEQFLDL